MSRFNDERKFKDRVGSNGGGQKSTRQAANWFFPFTPNKEQRDDINAIRPEDGPRFEALIQKAVESGYKLAIKWNVSRNAVQATCTGDEFGDRNPGKCVAAYHIDAQKALLILVYALETTFQLDSEWTKSQAGFDDSF